MEIRFFPNDKGNPVGKLADAELYFDGILAGTKLVGFGVWEHKDGRQTVTLPARQYTVNGERRSFALLRDSSDRKAVAQLSEYILDAWRAQQQALADLNGAAIAAQILAPEPAPAVAPVAPPLERTRSFQFDANPAAQAALSLL